VSGVSRFAYQSRKPTLRSKTRSSASAKGLHRSRGTSITAWTGREIKWSLGSWSPCGTGGTAVPATGISQGLSPRSPPDGIVRVMASHRHDQPSDQGVGRWLILIYRIPTEPTRLRASVWRRLKGLGAIYLQSSTAAIPSSPASERALRGLRSEIGEMGGVAYLLESTVLGGLAPLVETFNKARDDEYDEILDRCEDFLPQVGKEYAANHFTYAELEENDVDLVKLKSWLERVHSRDTFGASKYGAALEALVRCETVLEEYAARVYAEEGEEPSSD